MIFKSIEALEAIAALVTLDKGPPQNLDEAAKEYNASRFKIEIERLRETSFDFFFSFLPFVWRAVRTHPVFRIVIAFSSRFQHLSAHLLSLPGDFVTLSARRRGKTKLHTEQDNAALSIVDTVDMEEILSGEVYLVVQQLQGPFHSM